MLQKSGRTLRLTIKPATLALAIVSVVTPWHIAIADTNLPSLPEAVSQHVVLQTTVRGKEYVASFGGATGSSDQLRPHNKAWQLTEGNAVWQPLPAIPSVARLSGRMAATGVTMGNNFFIFTGQSKTAQGADVTIQDSYRFSPMTQTYTKLPDMPVPVSASLAVAYQNRYIYLVSGQHQDGAINLVQLFDNFSQKWSQATPYPGSPVFGHAGAIVDNQLLVCDGQSQSFAAQTSGQAQIESSCFIGTIDPKAANRIAWQKIPHHGMAARYQQTALTVELAGETMVAFIGGRTKIDTSPTTGPIYLYSFKQQRWLQAEPTQPIDHIRNLVTLRGDIYSVGGTTSEGNASSNWIKHQIKLLPE